MPGDYVGMLPSVHNYKSGVSAATTMHTHACTITTQGRLAKHTRLPALTAVLLCSGWVCYAEKTHGSYILPHIASSRSPQAIMGALIKQLLATAKGWDPARVYHVTVMPCYDKKLEASRDDFLVPGELVKRVVWRGSSTQAQCSSKFVHFRGLRLRFG